MKLDKELYTKHAKRLEAILNEKSTFAPYIARPDFAKVIEVSLNTLLAVEKKLTTVELPAKLSAKSLTKEFNKLGKNTFKLDDNFKYDDETDLIDNINYLSTYCKNIYKINIDELVEGKKVTASNPTVDLRGKPDVEDMAEGMGAAGMGFNPGMAMGPYDNPFVMGKAYAKLKTEMANGSLYTYKSKPRAVIGAKWAAVVTIGLTMIALIVMAVFAFMAAKLQIEYHTGESSTRAGALGNNAIMPGIMYILVACFGAYPMYTEIKSLIGRNENLKYYLTWSWILIFILMLLVFVMKDMRVTWLLSNTILDSPASAKLGFNAWKITYIVTMGLGASCIAPLVIGSICNPKQDQELLERKLKEFADEMATSSGFGPSPAQPTGADVQKPVEVKKSESKKKDTDKKPSKGDSKPKK